MSSDIGSLDLEFAQATAVRGLRWRFAAGPDAPVDLTGWAARLQVRPGKTAALAAAAGPLLTRTTEPGGGLACGLDAADPGDRYGFVEMDLTAAQVDGTAHADGGWYDLTLTPPGGTEPVYRTRHARWTVGPAITLPS